VCFVFLLASCVPCFFSFCLVSRSGIRPSTFHLHSPHADLASLLSRGLGSFHGLPGLSITFYPRVIDRALSGLCGGMDTLRPSLALPTARWPPPMSGFIAHIPPISAHGHGGGIAAGFNSIRHDGLARIAHDRMSCLHAHYGY
jgi:hypothetical protein